MQRQIFDLISETLAGVLQFADVEINSLFTVVLAGNQNYATLNKRNILTSQIITLVTRKVLFLCDNYTSTDLCDMRLTQPLVHTTQLFKTNTELSTKTEANNQNHNKI